MQTVSGPLSATIGVEEQRFLLRYFPDGADESRPTAIFEFIDKYYTDLTEPKGFLDVSICIRDVRTLAVGFFEAFEALCL